MYKKLYTADLPWPSGRFTVVVGLPEPDRDSMGPEEKDGYVFVLCHEDPGRSHLGRFAVPDDNDWKEGTLPPACEDAVLSWATRRVHDTANELRADRSLCPREEPPRLEPLGEGDAANEVRRFLRRPRAQEFLGRIGDEVPDRRSWLSNRLADVAEELVVEDVPLGDG